MCHISIDLDLLMPTLRAAKVRSIVFSAKMPALWLALHRIYAGVTPYLSRRKFCHCDILFYFRPCRRGRRHRSAGLLCEFPRFSLKRAVRTHECQLVVFVVVEADDTAAPAYSCEFPRCTLRRAVRTNECQSVAFAVLYRRICRTVHVLMYCMQARHATASCTNLYYTVREKNHFMNKCAHDDTNNFCALQRIDVDCVVIRYQRAERASKNNEEIISPTMFILP
jgi:hypothetical protein